MTMTYNCRICLQEESDRLLVIKPCKCNGTSRWVHRSCLERDRLMNPNRRKQCNECKTTYHIINDLEVTSYEHKILAVISMFIYVLGSILIVRDPPTLVSGGSWLILTMGSKLILGVCIDYDRLYRRYDGYIKDNGEVVDDLV